MAIKSCLTTGDVAKSEAAIKTYKPASQSKQKLIEKQEKMFYSLSKDDEFQKSIAGLKTKDKITAIQKKYADNGVEITRKKAHQMMKDGVTIAKPPPIVMPKPPIVAPGVPKPQPVIPKPKPEIVSIPKESVPEVIPPKPVPKEMLTEFKAAQTMDEALEEYKKYGHVGPEGSFGNWSEKKQLEVMNNINAEMNNLQKWTRGRKLGRLKFGDGRQDWVGLTQIDYRMENNLLQISRRNIFMKYGFGEKYTGSLDVGRSTVCKTMGTKVFRHEMGHVLWYDAKNKMRAVTSEFVEKFSSIKKSIIKNNISKYAVSDVEEFFAETFTIFASPKYKMGTLNKVFGSGFEELMEKILIGGS